MSLGPPPKNLPEEPPRVEIGAGRRLVRFFDPDRGPWSAHREYGPVAGMRFDHHPPPCREHRGFSVWYAAESLRGAVAEAFGRAGILDRETRFRLVVAEVKRPLPLVDLVGVAVRAIGATQELAASTDYEATQAWARAMHAAYPSLCGIRWRGRQAGSLCVVLHERAEMKHLAGRAWAVDEPRIWPRLARAARDCRLRSI